MTTATFDCSHRSPTSHEDERRLRRVLLLTAIVMVAEAVGGWFANSLALLADAGHMLADAAAMGLAIFAVWVGRRPATDRKTYGYQRVEVLAALVNGGTLFAIAAFVVWGAARRWLAPPAIEPRLMFGIAAVGLVANVISLVVLHHGHEHEHSLGVRGVSLHVLGDLLGSIGVLVAGAVIFLTGWVRADAIVSLLIATLIVFSGWRLVKDSVDVLLEGTPRHVSLADVEQRIATVPGVSAVHDLHVWTVTSGVVAMSGHAVVVNPADNQRVLEAVQARLGEIGIKHVTLQIERDPTCG
ncbi:MAG: cation transporter [Gemmatimonadetes bacterium]|nr:cation transporter [Gemmatimonadota bacterium]